MTYSFQDEVIKSLPPGHQFIRMSSVSPTMTDVITVKDGIKYDLQMAKFDVGTLFNKFPVIYLNENSTYNDLYEVISRRYGLGLNKNVDYYNSSFLPLEGHPVYLELPIDERCPAYCGVIRCYIGRSALISGDPDPLRDLTELDGSVYLNQLKVKSFLASKLFDIDKQLDIGEVIPPNVIELIVADMDKDTYQGSADNYRYILSDAKVIDLFSDGLSDIALVKTYQGNLLIRYVI